MRYNWQPAWLVYAEVAGIGGLGNLNPAWGGIPVVFSKGRSKRIFKAMAS